LDRRNDAENRQIKYFLHHCCNGVADRSNRGGATSVRSVPSSDPIQILTGKKVFISNGESTGDTAFRVSNLTYNAFYANMKNWARYELVSAPAEADLVFDPSFVLNFEGVLRLRLRLVILDPKTHIALWTIIEPVQPWARESTGRKNFDQAIAKLMDDVKKLTATPDATASK
jgi:hypothetical protein